MNTQFMTFDVYKQILAEHTFDEPYEVYLSGGEPLLHPQLLEFVEYALSLPNVDMFLLDSNSTTLEKALPDLAKLTAKYNKPIMLKVSINYHLVAVRPQHIAHIKEMVEQWPQFIWCLSIRTRVPRGIDKFIEEIQADPVLSKCSTTFHTIELVGRAKDNKIRNTVLSGKISPIRCIPWVFASDGTYFEHDFDARMKYEKELSDEGV